MSALAHTHTQKDNNPLQIVVADYPDVERIQAFYAIARRDMGQNQKFLREKSVEDIHTLVGKGAVIIAQGGVGPVIRGMISVRPEPLPLSGKYAPGIQKSFRAAGKNAEINSFVIDENVRGMGLSQTLIRSAEEYASKKMGISHVFARVVHGNEAGEAAFSRAGFSPSGQSFRYDDLSTQLTVMTKTLQKA